MRGERIGVGGSRLARCLAASRCRRPRSLTSSGPPTGPTPRPTPPSSPPPAARCRAALAETAVTGKGAGKVRVVCQGKGGRKSLAWSQVDRQGAQARLPDPAQPAQAQAHPQARRASCCGRTPRWRASASTTRSSRRSTASGNNDRVVVMPGRYTEPTSRKQPLNDPRCATSPRPTRAAPRRPATATRSPAPMTRTWSTSQGRAVPDAPPPQPAADQPPGHPRPGPLRALQPPARGQRRRAHRRDRRRRVRLRVGKSPEARPRKLHKHVVIRADRADGFVVHNLTARGALEHGIYIEETDGYRIDTVKMFWAADYGNLTFTSDHGLYTDCDGFGAGDAVLYPGAAPETGEQADKSLLSRTRRASTPSSRSATCAAACSPTRARWATPCGSPTTTSTATRAGISTDTISPAGHPGYPGRRRAGRPQLHLLEQPGPVRSRTRRSSPVVGILPSGVGHLLGRPQQRPRPRQLDLGQLAQRRLPAVDPGLPRHARGQRQPGQLVQGPRRCPPRAATASSATTSAGCRRASSRSRPCSSSATRWAPPRARAQRARLLVGRGRRRPGRAATAGTTTRDRTARRQRHRLREPATATTCCRPTAPPASSAGDPVKVAYLLSCFLAREGEAPPEECDWYTLPPKPGIAGRGQQAAALRGGRARVPEDGPRKQLEDQVGEVTGIADSKPPE